MKEINKQFVTYEISSKLKELNMKEEIWKDVLNYEGK